MEITTSIKPGRVNGGMGFWIVEVEPLTCLSYHEQAISPVFATAAEAEAFAAAESITLS